MNIELPVASSPSQTAPTSFYQQCNHIVQVIWSLSNHHEENKNMPNGYDFGRDLFPSGIENTEGFIYDPVTILWNFCSLGSPLCALMNLFKDNEKIKIIEIERDFPLEITLKKRQKSVFLFIKSCKETLKMTDAELFTITDVFRDDTNYFIKVVRALAKVVDKLKEKEDLPKELIPLPESLGITEVNVEELTDYRAKQIRELLETERSYVRDLELMRTYKNEAEFKNIITKEKALQLFANIDDLVDFQRRFLIGLESTLALPVNEQRIGKWFSTNEEYFSVYDVYCANQESASEMVVKEADYYTESWSKVYAKFNNLPEGTPVNPNNQIPSYLIRPVQRICKYPLLLERLYKQDKKDGHPYAEELLEGLEAIKRVVERTNETKRKDENIKKVAELKLSVEDWKGLQDDQFGELLLTEKFDISTPDGGERTLDFYLFDHILLAFKEGGKPKKSKVDQKMRIPLFLKNSYTTFTNFITNVENTSVLDQMKFQFKVDIRNSDGTTSLVLKTKKGIDLVDKWVNQLNKIKEKRAKKQSSSAFNNNTQLISSYNFSPEYVQQYQNDSSEDEYTEDELNRLNKNKSSNMMVGSQPNSMIMAGSQPNGMVMAANQPYNMVMAGSQPNGMMMAQPNGMMVAQPNGMMVAQPNGMMMAGGPYAQAIPAQQQRPYRSSSYSRNEPQEYNSSASHSLSSSSGIGYYGAGNEPRNPQYDIYSKNTYYDDSLLDDYFEIDSEIEEDYRSGSLSSGSYNPYYANNAAIPPQQYPPYATPSQPYYSHNRSNSSQFPSQIARNSSYPDFINGNYIPSMNEQNRMVNAQFIHHRNMSNPPVMPSAQMRVGRERSLSRGNVSNPVKGSASTGNIHNLTNSMNNMNLNGIGPAYKSLNQITPPVTPIQHSHTNPMLAQVPSIVQQNGAAIGQYRQFLPGLALGNKAQLKIHFREDLFTLNVPSTSLSYDELRKRIEKKLRLCARVPVDFDFNQLNIRYKDELGHHVPIRNDDDVFETFETTYRSFIGKRSSGTMVIEIFVH